MTLDAVASPKPLCRCTKTSTSFEIASLCVAAAPNLSPVPLFLFRRRSCFPPDNFSSEAGAPPRTPRRPTVEGQRSSVRANWFGVSFATMLSASVSAGRHRTCAFLLTPHPAREQRPFLCTLFPHQFGGPRGSLEWMGERRGRRGTRDDDVGRTLSLSSRFQQISLHSWAPAAEEV